MKIECHLRGDGIRCVEGPQMGPILEFSLAWFWSIANYRENDTLAFGVRWHCCWCCANLPTLSSSEAHIMIHFMGVGGLNCHWGLWNF